MQELSTKIEHFDSSSCRMRTQLQNIVIFGFGSQGGVQAQNLRDAGYKVTVALRKDSRRRAMAKKLGFKVETNLAAAARSSQVAVILLPDRVQPKFWKDIIHDNLPKNAVAIFAHGYSIFYKHIIPRKDLRIALVAPMGHADALRSAYMQSRAFTSIVASINKKNISVARAYAKAIGSTNIIVSTFKEEVETDLFAEQAVTCGGLYELIKAGIATLVKAGYRKDVATQCCLHEVEGLASLASRYGIDGALMRISDTARYGARTRGGRIITGKTRAEMRKILREIRSGKFDKEISRNK